jgi:predicted ATP-binding protein involved in virulence
MQIEKISVTGLFGIFNHVIPINTKEGITIIHALNGFGKTSTLRLLDGLFSSRYAVIQRIPFDRFVVTFDNGDFVEITQEHSDSESKTREINLSLSYSKMSGEVKKTSLGLRGNNTKKMELLNDAIDNIPELQRFSPRIWLYSITGERLSAEEVMDRFEDRLPPGIRNTISGDPDWLTKLKQHVKVRLIESQRLLNTVPNRTSRRYAEELIMLPTVSTYSEELSSTIKRKLEEYGNTSQLIDRTFPIRVMKHGVGVNSTDEEIKGQLTELERNRSRLIEVGLLDGADTSDLQMPKQKFDDSTKNLLSVYVSDMKEKIGVFDDIIEKIELFRRLVNQKFSYSQKRMNFDKEKGFVFNISNGVENDKLNPLSPADLSSGEQHEVVLLYELLFKVQQGSLVLIDEPELSLHVGWQKQFLKDLQEVRKLTQINMLIATHSPDIIQDRWDLTVELKGPQA